MPFGRLVATRDGVTITAQATGPGMWVGVTDGVNEPALRTVFAPDEASARALVDEFGERLASDGYSCERVEIPDDTSEDVP